MFLRQEQTRKGPRHTWAAGSVGVVSFGPVVPVGAALGLFTIIKQVNIMALLSSGHFPLIIHGVILIHDSDSPGSSAYLKGKRRELDFTSLLFTLRFFLLYLLNL